VGWIKLDRQITEHWLWESKPFSPGQAWVDLLMMAAHTTTTRDWKGSFLTQHRGEVFTSISALADRWGWSYKKVQRFIRTLERDKMVLHGDLPKGTRLTIENYTKFQGQGRADDRADDRATSEQTADNKRSNKKVKETRAREGSPDEPSAALEEVEATEPPDWFKEKIRNTFGGM